MDTYLHRFYPCQGTRDGLSRELQVVPPKIQSKTITAKAGINQQKSRTSSSSGFTTSLGMQKHPLDCALMTKTQQQLQKTLHIQRMGTAKPAITNGPLCILWPKHIPIRTPCGDKVTDREPLILNQRMPTARHEERQMRGKTQIWKMCWTAEKKDLWHCKQGLPGGCAFRSMFITIHATQEEALGSLPQDDRQTAARGQTEEWQERI